MWKFVANFTLDMKRNSIISFTTTSLALLFSVALLSCSSSASPQNAAAEQGAAGQVASGQESAAQVTSGQESAAQVSVEQVGAEQGSAEQVTVEQVAAEHLAAEQVGAKKNRVDSDLPSNREYDDENLFGIDLGNYYSVTGTIRNGDTFGALMSRMGVPVADQSKIAAACGDTFDVRRIHAGNEYEALFESKGGRPLFFIYDVDNYTHILFSLTDSIYVKRVEEQRYLKRSTATVTIESSLWNDVKRAGVSPLLALKISDIYAWAIDFFSLRKGDSFTVLYDELLFDGKTVDIDNIWYAEFIHAGKCYYAVNFRDGEKSSLYWNEKGESLRKAFLKAPLNFVRISSRFTYNRRHPVLKIVRPHTGVDYAAPKGTPVMTIGDGTVIFKGWSGGGGNTIKIRHNSIYTTSYMHLSGYAKGLSKGSRVRQGEVIGYVGSTGLSTGPHLDFRVYKNGTPIDPLKMESPSVEPVSKENMELFKTTLERYRYRLDSMKINTHLETLLQVL